MGRALTAVRRIAVQRYSAISWDIVWWEVAIGVVIWLTILGFEAHDWELFRRGTLVGFIGMPEVANPPYTSFFLYPLALLPYSTSLILFRLLTLSGLYLTSRLAGVNKWLMLLSPPAMWLLAETNLDGLVALGVALGYWALKEKKPLWQGVAVLLLFIKPHIGAPLAITFLIWQRDWRTFPISVGVVVASLGIWGFWPINYARELIAQSQGGRMMQFSSTSIDLFPWGVLLWPLLLLPVYSIRGRIAAIVGATMLSVPYAQSYSLLSMMAVPLPLWVYPIISARFAGAGVEIIRLAPIAVIVYPVLVYLYKWVKRLLTKL